VVCGRGRHAIGTFRVQRESNRERDTIHPVDRRTRDQVAELFRLFLVYDAIEQRARDGRLDPTELAPATLILRDLSFRCWERAFGPALATPAHRRFTLEWCRRNAELLMKEEVLPVIAHQVVASHIASQVRAIPADPAYEFSAHGPPGATGTALRRIYLIQSLTILFEELGGSGQIPPRLQAQLRRHLIRHVKSLFAKELPGEPAAPDPQLLQTYVRQGQLAPEAAERLGAALGFGGPVPPEPPRAPDSSASRLLPRGSHPDPDFQWAFDLIEELRQEAVEEEK
jgi:hypothetical protein